MDQINQGYEGIPTLLGNINEAARDSLRRISVTRNLLKKESLFPLTPPPKTIVFVEKGWMCVTLGDTVISLLKAGEAFMGPIFPKGSTSSAEIILVAATPATVIEVERVPLLALFNDRPDILFTLYSQTCERLTRSYIRLARKQVDTMEVQLASYLWSVGIPHDNGHRVLPPIRQEVVAACMGTGREEVNRKRKALVTSGKLFKIEDNWFIAHTVGLELAERGYGE